MTRKIKNKTFDEKIQSWANNVFLIFLARASIPLIGAMCTGIFLWVWDTHTSMTTLVAQIQGVDTRIANLESWRNNFDAYASERR